MGSRPSSWLPVPNSRNWSRFWGLKEFRQTTLYLIPGCCTGRNSETTAVPRFWARGSASHPEGTCPWRVLEETLRLKCWRHRGNCSWVPRRRQHSNSVSFRFSQGWRPGYRQHNRAERNPFHTIGEVTFTFARNCVVSSALLCRNLGPTIRKRDFWVNIRCSDGPVLAVRREWSCAVLLILPSLFHSTSSFIPTNPNFSV